MDNEASKDRLQDAVADLKTLCDEIRVDMHLASMDLRDEWKSLEKRLPTGAAATRVKEVAQEALVSLTQELRSFRERLHESRGKK
jgi:hypothetical protein